MNKTKKKTLKRVIALVLVVLLVAGLAAMPFLAQNKSTSEGPVASILHGNVTTSSINTEVIGGGTLTEQDKVSIDIPSSVKLTEYLVSNGDTVKAGDAIARVDRVSVMKAITEVQDTLTTLDEKIDEESDAEASGEIKALAGGIVKIVYVQEGDSVQDVMLEHGSLAVLSLDGLMAVKFETESKAMAGTEVVVTLVDGTTVAGEVNSNLAGIMIVTFKDDAYTVGEVVDVTLDDGTVLGSGEMYIYSPWTATAISGVIDTVNISPEDTVDPGDKIITISGVGHTATYQQLVHQRQEYENLMLELFEMYQTQTIVTECDGVISGVDTDSLQLLAADGTGYEFTLLVNSPDGNDNITYSNYVGKVTAVGQNGWAVIIDPRNVEITDYMNVSNILVDELSMIEVITYNPNNASGAVTPIYELKNNSWTIVNANEISAGDILLFANDSTGNSVWIVRIKATNVGSVSDTPMDNENQSGTLPTGTIPGVNEGSGTTGDSGLPNGTDVSGETGTTGGSGMPSGTDIPGETGVTGGSGMPSGADMSGVTGITGGSNSTGFPSGIGSSSMSGMSGNNGFTFDGSVSQTQEDDTYSLDVTSIASVTPQNTITLGINVSEMDVNSLSVGMTAEVKINALGGEKFEATITDINNTGSNNGGYSNYVVTLSMTREENMLDGMNATASIVIATTEDVIVVPADALVENGSETVVYTGYDENNKELINPVVVTVGVSDGQDVEIIDGLTSGTTYYYAYYDTLVVSNTPVSSGFSMFGR